jgi:lipopolysaccharide/colanic/teichoic acid biosynthesis glycosyltransferase
MSEPTGASASPLANGQSGSNAEAPPTPATRDVRLKTAPLQFAVKRALDYAGALGGISVGAPVLAAIALAVRLDTPGGALFAHQRVGLGGRVFKLLKFRTMVSNAPVSFNADGSTRVEPGDARVTRVGKHLRGALDELPQLLNVLRGDVSLVGPRPDMPVHTELYTPEEWHKLDVLPGITSLAAVLGRNDLPWKRRIAIDMKYIDRWSLALDLRILAQTLCLPLGVRLFTFSDILDD